MWRHYPDTGQLDGMHLDDANAQQARKCIARPGLAADGYKETASKELRTCILVCSCSLASPKSYSRVYVQVSERRGLILDACGSLTEAKHA